MTITSKQSVSAPACVGIDIGKNVFHLVGFDTDGKIVLRRKIKRLALIATFEKLPRCIVGMEACLSAHFVTQGRNAADDGSKRVNAIYSDNALAMEIRKC